jgi:hypothetical protein
MPATVTVGSTAVTAAPAAAAPFPVQAVVEEVDTCLVLDSDPAVHEPPQSYPDLVREMATQKPLTPGEIVVRRGPPLRFLAVVHDLDRRPTWSEAWIAAALANLLREFENRRVDTAALPLLGGVHGRLNPVRFVRLLDEALRGHGPSLPKRLWLIAPEDDCEWLIRCLDRNVRGKGIG